MIQIKEKIDCCGCNACGDVCSKNAISFKTDNEGFWYPEVDMEKCVDCGLCEKVCPIINFDELKKNDFDKPECYAAIHKNLEVRFDSTSGGLFSAFAEKFYREGGYVGGAISAEGGVKHFISNKKEDLHSIRRSKYQQSNLEGFFIQVRDLLKRGKKVFVCGGPCQMAALRGFLRKDYDNLLIADYVCRGINSPLVGRKYREYLERQHNGARLKVSRAKSKELGWRTMAVSNLYSNGDHEYITAKHNLFTQGYLSTGCFCRPSCYECKFKGFPRIADVTFADFWGIEKFDKTLDDNVGTSLVLLNSEKGKRYYDAIQQKIKSVNMSLEQAISGNPSILKPLSRPKVNREEFFKDVNEMPFEDVANKYFPQPNELTFKRKVKNVILCFKRAIVFTPWYSITPKWQFIKYNIFKWHVKTNLQTRGYINPHTHTVLDIRKGANVIINKPLTIGAKKIRGSKVETCLLVENGGSLIVDSPFAFGYQSHVEVFKGATLHIKNANLDKDGGANMGLTLICGNHIEIGQDVRIGRNVTIRDNNGGHYINMQGYKLSRTVKIGNHVWLCEGCTIMPGAKIGDGAIVAAHAVVNGPVPPNTLVVGNPARVVEKNIEWKF